MDALSGGRVIIGLGLGNNREEFQMLYPRRINWHRGKMLDESLEIFSSLLNNKVSTLLIKNDSESSPNRLAAESVIFPPIP